MTDHAQEIRRVLVDPMLVATRLGLTRGAKRQAGGLSVCCPAHGEKDPSCSITRGQDGTLRVKCFGCNLSGDVFSLVAAARGLDLKSSFRLVMLEAAELGGLDAVAHELRTGERDPAPRDMPPAPAPSPPKEYPTQSEVLSVWRNSMPLSESPECARALALRGLTPDAGIARGLNCEESAMPRWARFQGESWLRTGYRLILPVYDHGGAMRSLRAWRIGGDPSMPKRLPPAGHRATGLVLANDAALRWLRAPGAPLRLLIVEGEPDMLTAAQCWPGVAIVGVFSGAWTPDFSARIPRGSEIVIHTDHDDSGDKYAADIAKTLSKRTLVRRSKP